MSALDIDWGADDDAGGGSAEPTPVPMVDHALTYAARRVPVFPCNPQPGKSEKAPLVKGGFKVASTDPVQIRRWWRDNPSALIGVPTGPKSGWLVIDPDMPKKPTDADGVANWKALVAEHGAIPATRSHLTQGGGLHLVFRYPDGSGITIAEGLLAGKGINVRGNGGYVIVPPSRMNDGRSYRLADSSSEWTLAEAPTWLLDMIATKPSAKVWKAQGLPAELPAHLAKEAPDGIVLPEFDGPKPSPKAVARVCATFVRMLVDAPTAREMVWWKTCELAMHTTGGAELAHMAAAKHPDYDPDTTQAKLDRHVAGGFGPPTCGALQALYGDTSPCLSCSHFGNPTTSPVVIARREVSRAVAAEGTVMAEVGIAFTRPAIFVEPGEISITASKAMDALIGAGVPIYQRAGALAIPVREVLKAPDGKQTTVASFKEVTATVLVDWLNRAADFHQHSSHARKIVRIDPPLKVAETILSRRGEWKFQRVAGCVTAPMLRPDGTLLEASGYDSATELFHVRDLELKMPAIPPAPTLADAKVALVRLNALLVGFTFVSEVDRAVALSALMTPVLRGAMTAAPMHLIRAHSSGTGKSFLIDVATTIAAGLPWPATSIGTNPEELEKRLGALMLDGASGVNLDNVNGRIGGDTLCQVTERAVISIRVLGMSKSPRVECRATIFCNGNNTTVVADMARRTVICNLDALAEDPERRTFDFDPLAEVIKNRGLYVAAVLTIAMAYRAAGTPKVCPPIGSYADWTKGVRAPLIWLGMADPVASQEAAKAEDPARSAIRELIAHWEITLNAGQFYTASEVEVAARPPVGDLTAPFHEFLLRQCGVGTIVSTVRLGNLLSRNHGQIFDGRRLEMNTDKKRGNHYALVQVKTG